MRQILAEAQFEMVGQTNTTAGSCDFEKTYEHGSLPAMREMERSVLGCDYGGTSWTTRSQADQIAATLGLGAGVRLLDIGSGTGWPGLFLAGLTGCDVTLVDIPLVALRLAAERAIKDDLAQQTRAIAASGAALPFGDRSFDTVSHSDVLCCMPEKLAMLQECRRVLRADGRMLFSVIAPAPSLSETDYAEAIEAGPPFVEVPGDYSGLLHESGWSVLEHIDATVAYRQCLRTLVDHTVSHAKELTDAIGSDDYLAMKERRKFQISAVDRGLLIREIFVTETN